MQEFVSQDEVEKMPFSEEVKRKGLAIFFYFIVIVSFFFSAFPFLLAFKYPAIATGLVGCNILRIMINEPESRGKNLIHLITVNLPLFIYIYTLIR